MKRQLLTVMVYQVKSQKILFGIAINNTHEKHEAHEQNMKNMVNIYIIV